VTECFLIMIVGVSLLSRMVQTCDPNILVGYVGSSINIPCTESSKCNAITWSHTRLIKGGDPLVNPLSRSNDTDESGTCYLRISSAELQDAGKYECIHRRGVPPACISHVVIIGKNYNTLWKYGFVSGKKRKDKEKNEMGWCKF